MLEDVMRALERLPLWKRVSDLPEKVQALEARIAALEAKLAGDTGTLCPLCEKPAFRRIGSAPHPQFGFAGIKLDSYACGECGHEEERERSEGAAPRR